MLSDIQKQFYAALLNLRAKFSTQDPTAMDDINIINSLEGLTADSISMVKETCYYMIQHIDDTNRDYTLKCLSSLRYANKGVVSVLIALRGANLADKQQMRNVLDQALATAIVFENNNEATMVYNWLVRIALYEGSPEYIQKVMNKVAE